MLPLPLGPANPWMSVLGVYLLGLLIASIGWRRAPRAAGQDLVFYLSVLGWGLFSYYQGRSHILNLITVCWPALLISAILADRAIRFVHAGRLHPLHLTLPSLALAVLLYADWAFVEKGGALWADAWATYSHWGTVASPIVSDELAFIRAHSREGDSCVILARRQGLYLASARLGSPLEGPGYIEMLTVKDRDKLMSQLTTGRFECVFIGVGDHNKLALDADIMAPFSSYDVVASSPMHTMIFLRPKEALAGSAPQ